MKVINAMGWIGSIYRGRLQSGSGSRYGNQTGDAGRAETAECCCHHWRPAPAAAGMPSTHSYPSSCWAPDREKVRVRQKQSKGNAHESGRKWNLFVVAWLRKWKLLRHQWRWGVFKPQTLTPSDPQYLSLDVSTQTSRGVCSPRCTLLPCTVHWWAWTAWQGDIINKYIFRSFLVCQEIFEMALFY